MLTRRGWSVLGASAGLWVGARVLGLVQLVALAVAGLGLLAVAVGWVRRNPVSLRARRTVRERLQVGVEGRVDLLVEQPGGRAAPTLALSDEFDGGRRSARFLLPPAAPDEPARAAYRIPTERRGRFELGPLRATVSDPFGLASVTRRVLGTEEVIVYPRVHDILPVPETGGDELDRDQPRAHGRPDAAGEFLTLREYAPGDDLRRVHWRSTARRDRLMVCQHEARRRSPVLVLLDVRPGAHDATSFERAVEACASIAAVLEGAGRPYDVMLSTGVAVGTPGRRHLVSVLDELAVVEAHGPEQIVAATSRRRTGVLVAITGRADAGALGAISLLVRSGGSLTVVATRDDVAVVPPAGRRVRPLVVHATIDRPFAQSWNEAVLSWQRSVRTFSSPSPAPA